MTDRQDKQINDIHALYLEGESYPAIAAELGISLGRVQAIVLKYRAKDPLNWPKRVDAFAKRLMGVNDNDHIIATARYECTACAIAFALEMSGDILKMRVACPTCQDDEGVRRIGIGYMFDETLEVPLGNKGKKLKSMYEEMNVFIKNGKEREPQPRTAKKVYYSDEQRAFICYMYDKLTNKDIAIILNRSTKAIDGQMKAIRKRNEFDYYFYLGEKLYMDGKLLKLLDVI